MPVSEQASEMARKLRAATQGAAPKKKKKRSPLEDAVEGGFINDRRGEATKRARAKGFRND